MAGSRRYSSCDEEARAPRASVRRRAASPARCRRRRSRAAPRRTPARTVSERPAMLMIRSAWPVGLERRDEPAQEGERDHQEEGEECELGRLGQRTGEDRVDRLAGGVGGAEVAANGVCSPSRGTACRRAGRGPLLVEARRPSPARRSRRARCARRRPGSTWPQREHDDARRQERHERERETAGQEDQHRVGDCLIERVSPAVRGETPTAAAQMRGGRRAFIARRRSGRATSCSDRSRRAGRL